MLQKKVQTFNDGICNIYTDTDEGLAIKAGPLRFEERTVGMGRYWLAMQAQAQIDRMIRAPRQLVVEANDVAVLHDGTQYTIKQVQYPPDVLPLCMDLSLEKVMNAKNIV